MEEKTDVSERIRESLSDEPDIPEEDTRPDVTIIDDLGGDPLLAEAKAEAVESQASG